MFNSLKLKQKMMLLPLIAVAALATVFIFTAVLGWRNRAQLERVERGYFPALEVSRELESLLAAMQRGMQDAVAASDKEALQKAASLREAFLNRLEASAQLAVHPPERISALRAELISYADLAASTSAKMIERAEAGSEGMDESIVATLATMTQKYNGIRATLQALTEADRQEVRAAFQEAQARNSSAVWLTLFITIICAAGMLLLVYSALRGAARQLAEVRDGLLRMGAGDFSQPVQIIAQDELGEMGSEINRTGDYLRDMARVATTIAEGDLTVTVSARSTSDSLGMAFQQMARSLGEKAVIAKSIATGNLGVETSLRSERDVLGASFRDMVRSLDVLVNHVKETAAQISSASGELAASATQHERGAAEQSSAVEETRRTMSAILDSGLEVSKASDVVLRNAEKTQNNNQIVNQSILNLSRHTQRITEILEVIKDIANKSELLALNAALEGTKAGEAGRGFSLVASQMQRLAESVMTSVRDIKALTGDVREAMNGSVTATEAAGKLAAETTDSARQIGLIMQQYRGATEQVSHAMDEIAQVATQTAAGSNQILDASRDLGRLSEQLVSVVEKYRQESASAPRGAA